MKKLLSMFIVVVCVLSLSAGAFAANEVGPIAGNNLIKQINSKPELEMVVTKIYLSYGDDNILRRSEPDKPASAVFYVDIKEGIYVRATAQITVKGVYSQADGWAQIDSITATFSGDYASQFTYLASVNNTSTASIYIQRNYQLIGIKNFKIATNGKISIE